VLPAPTNETLLDEPDLQPVTAAIIHAATDADTTKAFAFFIIFTDSSNDIFAEWKALLTDVATVSSEVHKGDWSDSWQQ